MEDLSQPNEVPSAAKEETEDDETALEDPAAATKESIEATTCVVDRSVFDIPEGYLHNQAGQNRVRYRDDEILQMAILRSQLEQQGGEGNLVKDLII